MSNFNVVERSVARFLSRFPFVKKFAKLIYARITYIRVRKAYRSKSISDLSSFSLSGKSSFFGYYDKSPENEAGMVLACVTPSDTSTNPTLDDKLSLVVFDSNGKKLQSVKVEAYNWQQGCRAIWIDSDLFIYNDFDNNLNCYISRVHSVSENRTVRIFKQPVQDIFNKEFFISLNYRRLMSLRPDYGYRNISSLTDEEVHRLNDDGLWKIDYETGESRLLISISDVTAVRSKVQFDSATHKLNHVMISPDGSRFIFMHRYLIKGQRFDRLLIADSLTGQMRILSDYDMVSHCYWVDNSNVLGYMRGPNYRDAYWLINVDTIQFSELPCKELIKFGDGHPHVHGDWFITDTYPDKARMQHLLLCNWKTGEVREIGEFFHGFEYQGESRCDLHPRISLDGKSVFFDSVFSGKRKLYKMGLPS